MGNKELQDVINCLVALANLGIKIQKDKAVGVQDLPLVMALAPLIGPALSEKSAAFAELKALSSPDAQVMVDGIMASLALDDGKAKAVFGKALDAAIALGDLVKAVRA